jgi:hypothetical protein
MEFSLKEDAFDLDEMPELKLNSIKPSQDLQSVKKTSLIDKLNHSEMQNNENSLLQIDYDD